MLVVAGLAVMESAMFNSLEHAHVFSLSFGLHIVVGLSRWNEDWENFSLLGLDVSHFWFWLFTQFIASKVALWSGWTHALWNTTWLVFNINHGLPRFFMLASLNYVSIAVLFAMTYVSPVDTGPWDRFQGLWNDGYIRQAQDVCGSCCMTLGSALNSIAANQFLHKEKPSDPKAVLEVHCHGHIVHQSAIVDDEARPCVWPIIGHRGLLGGVRAGLHSLFHALLIRNMRLTPETTRPDIWQSVADQFCLVLRTELLGVPWEYTDHREWADSYDKSWKRREVHQYLDEVEAGDVVAPTDEMLESQPLLRKTVLKRLKITFNNAFAKVDEVLNFKDSAIFKGVVGLKPRTIQAVKLFVQYMLQPSILTAAKRLKTALKEPFDIHLFGRKKTFWFTFGSGVNGEDLTAWLVKAKVLAMTGVTCTIVCGDDSLTVINVDGQLIYIEIDYSHFDQSQKKAQNLAERLVLAALGCSQSVCDILKLVCRAPCRGRKRNGKVPYSIRFYPSGANRVTGAPNTSLSNSTNNILGIIIASFFDFSSEGWNVVGFKAVQHRFMSIQETTFLRGTWWPHSDGTERWGILPSAFIKLTKVQTRLDTRRKFNQIARGMVMGMGDIPNSFPVLGAYKLKVLEVCPLLLNDSVVEIRNKYKPKSDITSEIDRDFVMEWMCSRYDTTRDEIIEFEAELLSLKSLPSYVGHPLPLRLQEDY
jgi:hypothetical protein